MDLDLDQGWNRPTPAPCSDDDNVGGVTRASLGVQDVNPEVQEAVNRHQPFSTTKRAVTWLRQSGIDDLNIDLMYGLPHQSAERVAATVDAVRTLRPDRVTLTDEDRLRRAIIERLMCDLQVDLESLCGGLRHEWSRLLPELKRLEPMVADGLVTMNGPNVQVTDMGRSLLRSICAVFDAYLGDDGARHSIAVQSQIRGSMV